MEKRYYINYGTGAGNEWAETLEEAMQNADANACYTQRSICILDTDTGDRYCRYWYGVCFDPDVTEDTEDDIISFGNFGHYAGWYKED